MAIIPMNDIKKISDALFFSIISPTPWQSGSMFDLQYNFSRIGLPEDHRPPWFRKYILRLHYGPPQISIAQQGKKMTLATANGKVRP